MELATEIAIEKRLMDLAMEIEDWLMELAIELAIENLKMDSVHCLINENFWILQAMNISENSYVCF